MKDVPWFNFANALSSYLNVNEYSERFVLEILKISPVFGNVQDKLIKLMKIYSLTDENNEITGEEVAETDKVYSLEDLDKDNENAMEVVTESTIDVADNEIWATNWQLASSA